MLLYMILIILRKIAEVKEMINVSREEIIKNLISNITAACKERDMSINEFCRKCNVHKSIMDNLKRNNIPAVPYLANIAIFLDISIDELIGLSDQIRKNRCQNDSGCKKIR